MPFSTSGCGSPLRRRQTDPEPVLLRPILSVWVPRQRFHDPVPFSERVA